MTTWFLMTHQYQKNYTFFKNATKGLNIRQNFYPTDESNEIEDQVK